MRNLIYLDGEIVSKNDKAITIAHDDTFKETTLTQYFEIFTSSDLSVGEAILVEGSIFSYSDEEISGKKVWKTAIRAQKIVRIDSDN